MNAAVFVPLLCTLLVTKQRACCAYQGYLVEVHGRHGSLDQLSDAVQSLGQNRTAAQLAQLHSRYTSLLTFVKDAVKRLELEVEQYDQYLAAHAKCAKWLDVTTEEVTASRQTTGDLAQLHARLDRLQVGYNKI